MAKHTQQVLARLSVTRGMLRPYAPPGTPRFALELMGEFSGCERTAPLLRFPGHLVCVVHPGPVDLGDAFGHGSFEVRQLG